jgi:uncharacterized membrane protein YkvA (DUF1232 family)
VTEARAPVQERLAYKLLAAAAGIYLVLPFDAIPDVVPVVGHFDDALVLGLVFGVIRGDVLGNLRRRRLRRGVRERFTEFMALGEFSADWFTANIPDWEPIMRELSGRPSRMLELGSFEGLSASYVLWRLPQAQLTCVDTFEGFLSSPELPRVFDRNVARAGPGRVRKLVGTTRSVLPKLVDDGERFDFVYVDASHLALDVAVDAALSWQLLNVGGVLVFDDYGLPRPHRLLGPTAAIDSFIDLIADCGERIPDTRQVMIRKVADVPAFP